jgi:uncharacterized protein YjbI with pentapeptide repeats
LTGANLAKASLRGASGDQVNLDGADLNHGTIDGANFADSSFKSADLTFMYAIGADFSRSEMYGVRCAFSKFQGAIFHGAHLELAVFTGCDQSGASFIRAELQGRCLTTASSDQLNSMALGFIKHDFNLVITPESISVVRRV